jgi:hypothetical protein
MGEFNKFMLWNMERSKRAWLITKDAKFENQFVKNCTKLALETDKLDTPKDFDKQDQDFEF